MINGIKFLTVTKHCDDRGFFAEIFRSSESLIEPKQFSMTKTNPGIIKAFHKHLFQTDLWFVSSGMVRVILRDVITEEMNTFYMGEDNPTILLIRPNIWHGYQVLGNNPAFLFYATNQVYNPKDEFRIPYNNFGDDIWKIKNR